MYVCTITSIIILLMRKLGLGEIKPHGQKARCYVTCYELLEIMGHHALLISDSLFLDTSEDIVGVHKCSK